MTSALRTSAYPAPVDELLPDARALAARLGELPSRNKLMKELRIGATKATALLERLSVTTTDEPTRRPTSAAREGGSDAEAVQLDIDGQAHPFPPAEPAPARLHLVPSSPVGPLPDTTTPDSTKELVTGGVDLGSDNPTMALKPASESAPETRLDADPEVGSPAVKTGSSVRRKGPSGRVVAYLGAGLGGFGSIAANVAHSFVQPRPEGASASWTPSPDWSPEPGAVIGAMFWPIAVLVAVEILARVDWPAGRRWVALRFGGLLPVALVAAVVSYRHLSGLLHHWGEDSLTVALGPLAVDGLMVMATAALLAIGKARKSTASRES